MKALQAVHVYINMGKDYKKYKAMGVERMKSCWQEITSVTVREMANEFDSFTIDFWNENRKGKDEQNITMS